MKTLGRFATLVIFVSSAYAVEPVWITPTDEVCKANGGQIEEKICHAKWDEANKICEVSGGVLPTLDELKAVITGCTGKIDAREENQDNLKYYNCYQDKGFTIFTYWSSDTYEERAGNAWYVGFFYGSVYQFNKKHFNYVRCIKPLKH